MRLEAKGQKFEVRNYESLWGAVKLFEIVMPVKVTIGTGIGSYVEEIKTHTDLFAFANRISSLRREDEDWRD